MIHVTGGVVGLRDDKKRATREAITQVALRRFRVGGFAQTTVREIAGEVPISEATFFNYFPSKEAVLQSVADAIMRRTVERLDVAVSIDAPVPARLGDLLTAFAGELGDDPELASLVLAHGDLFGSAEAVDEHRRLVVELFEQGQSRGEIRDDMTAPELADFYAALVRVSIGRWANGGDRPRDALLASMRHALELLLAGCLAESVEARSGGGRSDAAAELETTG
jgi:AcrR family transcriptional regulator